jgi:hypothetical protein
LPAGYLVAPTMVEPEKSSNPGTLFMFHYALIAACLRALAEVGLRRGWNSSEDIVID